LATHGGSIYENQRGMVRQYFEHVGAAGG